MVKSDKWEMSIGSSNLLRHGQEQVFGSSTIWPQSSFGCSFCKRQFRSAQALGGHMNVHRRERAKLASLQDHHHHNPPINNYSKFSSSSSSSSSSSPSASKICKSSSSHHFLMSHQQDHEKVTKVRKIMTASAGAHYCGGGGGGGGGDKVRLDLNMGLFRDPKEDLDLELRLGYPNY